MFAGIAFALAAGLMWGTDFCWSVVDTGFILGPCNRRGATSLLVWCRWRGWIVTACRSWRVKTGWRPDRQSSLLCLPRQCYSAYRCARLHYDYRW